MNNSEEALHGGSGVTLLYGVHREVFRKSEGVR
jgi:hypothetical protein